MATELQGQAESQAWGGIFPPHIVLTSRPIRHVTGRGLSPPPEVLFTLWQEEPIRKLIKVSRGKLLLAAGDGVPSPVENYRPREPVAPACPGGGRQVRDDDYLERRRPAVTAVCTSLPSRRPLRHQSNAWTPARGHRQPDPRPLRTGPTTQDIRPRIAARLSSA